VLSGYAPCNSAPYIGIDGTSSLFGDTAATPAWITSILISSNDVLGFNIDQLQIQDAPFAAPTSIPEPATTLLMGGGLALAALWNLKRKLCNASEN
jgi:PEP-CTERM motif